MTASRRSKAARNAPLVVRRWGRLAISMGLLELLTGCPVSDPYYVDPGGSAGAGGGSCLDGTCAADCCGDLCTDLNSDPSHCGSCTHACPASQSCVDAACVAGWAPVAGAPAAFVAREQAAFVAFDTRLFVFGGLDAGGAPLNSAAIYDAGLNRWTLVKIDAATPSARASAGAVWSGDRVIVYGGVDGSGQALLDGASYDPVSDAWTRIADGPLARAPRCAGASASAAVFWGGTGQGQSVAGADRYDVATDSWRTALASGGDPGALEDAASAFATDDLYVYGGLLAGKSTDHAARYSLTSNAWTALPAGPPARYGAFSTWDGLAYFVWGGTNGGPMPLRDGKFFYNTLWMPIGGAGAPAARWAPARQTGWAFALGTADVVFLGGLDAQGVALTDGARYDAFASTWSAIPPWPSGEAHEFGVAAKLGDAIVVWGGRDGDRLSASGERWAP